MEEVWGEVGKVLNSPSWETASACLRIPYKYYSLACFHSHDNQEDNQMIPILLKRNLSLQVILRRDHIAFTTEPEFAPRSLASEWSFFTLLQLYSCSQDSSTSRAAHGVQGLIAKTGRVVARRWQQRAAELDLAGLSSGRGGKENRERRKLQVGFQGEGSWTWRAECSTQWEFWYQLFKTKNWNNEKESLAPKQGPGRN